MFSNLLFQKLFHEYMHYFEKGDSEKLDSVEDCRLRLVLARCTFGLLACTIKLVLVYGGREHTRLNACSDACLNSSERYESRTNKSGHERCVLITHFELLSCGHKLNLTDRISCMHVS
jgi:hypothetical protein